MSIISHGGVTCIAFADLEFILRSGSIVYLYTATGCYTAEYSMVELMKLLPVNEFCRVSKSHIVSLPKVMGWQRSRVKVGERWLPVSQYYRQQVIAHLAGIINCRIQTIFIASRL